MDLQPIPVNGGLPVFPPTATPPGRPNQKDGGGFTPVAVNGLPLHVQGVRELKSGMTIDQATDILTAKHDGLDAVLFTIKDTSGNEKGYLAYGDSLDFQGLKKPDGHLYFNGQATNVKFMKREVNSVQKGARDGALTAVKGMTDTVIDTTKGLVAGVKPATTIAFGALAVVGVMAAVHATTAGVAVGAAAGGAALVGVGGSTFAGLVSTVASTVFPALLVLAGAAVVGSLFVAGVGAVGGAVDAMKNKNNQDYSQVSKASQ